MAFTLNKTITITSTSVGSADLTNFPFFMAGRADYLRTTGYTNGAVTSTAGFDICFFSDSGLTTLLKWEVIYFNSGTGTIFAFVTIPTVSHTANTLIYMGVGNSAITTDQSNKATAWASTYKAVYHFNDGAGTTSYADSSNAGFGVGTPTAVGTVAPGFIPGTMGATSYNGGTSDIALGNTGAHYLTAPGITVECWMKPTNVGNGQQNFVSKGNNGTDTEWQLGMLASGKGYWSSYNGAPSGVNGTTTTVFANNVLYRVVGTYDGTTWKFYVNGALDTSTAGAAYTTSIGHLIGAALVNTSIVQYFQGYLGEVRVSNTALSAGWIGFDYLNLINPGNFASCPGFTFLAGPTATKFLAPIGLTGAGAPQKKTPSASTYTPTHYVPTPVGGGLPNGQPGTAYSTTISIQGGTSPYTIMKTSGSFPPGLSLSGATISGTPTTTGTSTFTIGVTDSLGFTGSQIFSITISSGGGGSSAFAG